MAAEIAQKPDGLVINSSSPRDAAPKTHIHIWHESPKLHVARLAEAESALMSFGAQFSLKEAVAHMRIFGDPSALGEVQYGRSDILLPHSRTPEFDYSVVLWSELQKVTPGAAPNVNHKEISLDMWEENLRKALQKGGFSGNPLELRIQVLREKERKQRNRYSGTDLRQNVTPVVLPFEYEPPKHELYQGKAARVVLKPDGRVLLENMKQVKTSEVPERPYTERKWKTITDLSSSVEHMADLLEESVQDADVAFYNREGKRIV